MGIVEAGTRLEEHKFDETLYQHMKNSLSVVTDSVLLWGNNIGASYNFTQRGDTVVRIIDFQSDLRHLSPMGIGLTEEERIKLYSKKDHAVFAPARPPTIQEVALMYGKLAIDYPDTEQTRELGKYLKGLMAQQETTDPTLMPIREALEEFA